MRPNPFFIAYLNAFDHGMKTAAIKMPEIRIPKLNRHQAMAIGAGAVGAGAGAARGYFYPREEEGVTGSEGVDRSTRVSEAIKGMLMGGVLGAGAGYGASKGYEAFRNRTRKAPEGTSPTPKAEPAPQPKVEAPAPKPEPKPQVPEAPSVESKPFSPSEAILPHKGKIIGGGTGGAVGAYSGVRANIADHPSKLNDAATKRVQDAVLKSTADLRAKHPLSAEHEVLTEWLKGTGDAKGIDLTPEALRARGYVIGPADEQFFRMANEQMLRSGQKNPITEAIVSDVLLPQSEEHYNRFKRSVPHANASAISAAKAQNHQILSTQGLLDAEIKKLPRSYGRPVRRGLGGLTVGAGAGAITDYLLQNLAGSTESARRQATQ